jgi:hypothetical protein
MGIAQECLGDGGGGGEDRDGGSTRFRRSFKWDVGSLMGIPQESLGDGGGGGEDRDVGRDGFGRRHSRG